MTVEEAPRSRAALYLTNTKELLHLAKGGYKPTQENMDKLLLKIQDLKFEVTRQEQRYNKVLFLAADIILQSEDDDRWRAIRESMGKSTINVDDVVKYLERESEK